MWTFETKWNLFDKEASFWQNRYNFMLFDKNWVRFASLTKILFYKYNFILTKFFFKLNNLLYCEFRLS